ncbi:DUF4183 domain-containing protein [Bacillus ginsengihumi]|uniref:DUF4183 domain-containing protein n=1 Tax=Heyndrickxia ginsengihumi TaxID=363870 RepID=A0A6M0P5E5_9BACI|nr:DUF4183 domain-containing protein [Heyndrickxia ginsengihumi]MCM3024011.1 DUF4183 domain-containing protein [Heyndrickxia ginsengihumi]NEY19130.1 DUF4183 domain-containing protein [Heyndrickxia ginsengihumi]
MALKIMKLAVSATTNVTANPVVSTFFYENAAQVVGAGTITIPVESFWTDTGANASTLPALTTNNSFFNVFINGIQQMGNLLAYTPGDTGTGQLVVTVPEGSTVEAGVPIVLSVTNYTPAAATDILT